MYSYNVTGGTSLQELVGLANINWPQAVDYSGAEGNDGIPHYRISVQNTGATHVAVGSLAVAVAGDSPPGYEGTGYQLGPGDQVWVEAEGQWLWAVGDDTGTYYLSVLLIVV